MTDATPVVVPVVSGREKVGEVQVAPGVLDGPVREHLLHEMVKSQLASRRAGTASTKTRAFVSGGGKKPWKQKGTGRARAGSTRSPLWAGGAVIFGPQPRDYSYRLPRSARKAALRSALAQRHAEGKLLVVDGVSLTEPKTKRMIEWLAGIGVSDGALVVLGTADDGVLRATRNLPHTRAMLVSGLNVYDVLRHPTLVMTRDALEQVAARLGGIGMTAAEVVQGPVITEKGTLVNELGNQVVFRVHARANKIEIRQAVETLFKVKVEKVRTSRQLGKIRRVGKHMGRRPNWKKAYVTLAEGSRIDFFEGA